MVVEYIREAARDPAAANESWAGEFKYGTKRLKRTEHRNICEMTGCVSRGSEICDLHSFEHGKTISVHRHRATSLHRAERQARMAAAGSLRAVQIKSW